MYHYVHGGNIYDEHTGALLEGVLDFSANINPMGIPVSVYQAMVDAISNCHRYPDPFCRELTDKVALFEGVRPSQLLFLNGAAEVLFRLALAIKPKKALLCAPTFSDYEKALKTVNCQIEYYPLSETNEFQLEEDYLDRISPELDVLILCNPANPTGQITERPTLKKILDKAIQCNTTVVVDECFMDLVSGAAQFTAKSWLDDYSNLVVLRAFTKNFALPGIRLGYAISSGEAILLALRENGQDWSVSTTAQAAGIAATMEGQYLIESRSYITNERILLLKQLKHLGLRPYPSFANYILFRTDGKIDLQEALMKKGILIRSCSNYRNLGKEYYRIAVKTHEENKVLLAALQITLQEMADIKWISENEV